MDELKAENVRLTAMLLDYWGEFGCVEADNGKFRKKAYDLVETEMRDLIQSKQGKQLSIVVDLEDPKTILERLDELRAKQHG